MTQERKVVTVLFCDLVGFTSQAEELDPEDVAALLGPYQARVKEELERYGGTVEKFIGDAVMALFGAPTAHEDDPERAVRAALAIREFAEDQDIELRIGVTTGEALVDVDARPAAGETMATGDVVNTAARLQAAAPVNGILVSERTYVATTDVITYREASPVEAKGKAKPVPAWQALAAEPVAERSHTSLLVGRQCELEQLRAALERSRAENATQLLTLVGAPGIGKSRLVHELVRGDGDFSWRKGRCLPYGEGVTFWALGEVVKRHLGILESDSPEEAERKLGEGVGDPWIARNLRPLIGLGETREAVGDRRAETFAAWREFLAALAAEQPLALVLEDLHWADDALLDFVTHVFEWAREAPLLLLCTARPELLERRPGWGANDPRALTLALTPLSDEDTAQLFTALVHGRAGDELLACAGGNPLYAEQYARLVAEHGSLDELPATVHGIIAARLDALPEDAKALVQDAAVIGRVFWSGAAAALSGHDRWSIEERLLALERREVVRREQFSSVEGETQYAFRHILLRDVAYSQIPRATRSAKHRLAAEWIEGLGRPDDHAEMLAHHYISALEYAAAAGEETTELAERARTALSDAGDRALALHAFAAAARLYERAVSLCPADDPERPLLLFRQAKALSVLNEGADVLAAARDALLVSGDADRAAEAEARLGQLRRMELRMDDSWRHFENAAALVEGRPSSYSKAFVLWHLARMHVLSGRNEEGMKLGEQALAIAEELELADVRAGALVVIGLARVGLGDPAGARDLERAIEVAEAAGSYEAFRGYQNLGVVFSDLGDLRRAGELIDEAVAFAERVGHVSFLRFGRANQIEGLFQAGRWDEALDACESFLAELDPDSPYYQEGSVRLSRARIRLARGDTAGALADCDSALEQARAAREPQILDASLPLFGLIYLEAGRRELAEAIADELAGTDSQPQTVFDLALLLAELERPRDAAAAVESIRLPTRWVDAARAYLAGDLVEAADVLFDIGELSLEAYVRLRAAERLVDDGKHAEGREQLDRALAFYRSVRAGRYLARGEALLSAAS